MRLLSLVLAVLFGSTVTLFALAADPPLSIDRSTPRRSFEIFTNATRAGDFTRAASVLDLRNVPRAEQAAKGPELAKELATVLDQKLAIDGDDLPDDAKANTAPGAHVVKVGTIRLPDNEEVDVTMTLGRVGSDPAWLFAPTTVERIPALYAAYGPAWAEKYVPRWLTTRAWDVALWQWIGIAVALIAGVVLGLGAAHGSLWLGERLAKRTPHKWDDLLFRRSRGPVRLLFAMIAIGALLAPLRLAEAPRGAASTLLKIGIIIAIGWALARIVAVLTDSLEARAVSSSPERFTQELNLRGIRTRVVVLRRIGGILIAVVTASLVLLQFEAVRSVGVSILASAGLAGIVVGVAAQKTLATLLAGIQLSITQPIKIGDTVVVENENGTIEEINLTYVVVKTWDERRLIVPMTLFLEHPFENWTKVSSPLTGVVMLRADFNVPMDELRKEFEAILTTHPLFDGRVKAAHLVDATERMVEVRFLMSASDASRLFNLRCDVRERLIVWLRTKEKGRYLPLARVDVNGRSEQFS